MHARSGGQPLLQRLSVTVSVLGLLSSVEADSHLPVKPIYRPLTGEVVGGLRAKYGGPAQLLFEDHCKPCLLPDLKIAEESGLVVPGTW